VHLTAAGIAAATAVAWRVSTNPVITKLADQVSALNAQLDHLTRSVAGTARVALLEPTPADLQAALAAVRGPSGTTLDAGYVRYLWQADSALLPISTTVCTTTRNAAVHRLAARADTIIATQLPMLMRSGLLDMAVLPTAPPPSTAVDRLPGGVPMDDHLVAQTRSGAGFLVPPPEVAFIVLVGATTFAAATAWRLFNRSRFRRRRPVRRRHVRPRRDGPFPSPVTDPPEADQPPAR